ncbi:tail completion protein gp17 [Sphingobium scionense]|uniref:DUF3168 domain-containing protein n=1 Tax=Sphingobium scionense TaxID=1404341 RepID=A0A7W6LY74_9SPHN|nr:DUF3168 domain-containing protein [Sphingobium scionense]MBB4151676.1 hypothetical protein [Sphingobium scionense]
MSAEVAIRSAVIAALKADSGLMDRLNGLFDGAPARASAPYGVVGECLGSDWGAKDVEGRELRLSISLHDMAETAGRLGELLARIDPVIRLAQASGWRIVTASLLRSRIARAGERGWLAVADYRIRVVRESSSA